MADLWDVRPILPEATVSHGFLLFPITLPAHPENMYSHGCCISSDLFPSSHLWPYTQLWQPVGWSTGHPCLLKAAAWWISALCLWFIRLQSQNSATRQAKQSGSSAGSQSDMASPWERRFKSRASCPWVLVHFTCSECSACISSCRSRANNDMTTSTSREAKSSRRISVSADTLSSGQCLLNSAKGINTQSPLCL